MPLARKSCEKAGKCGDVALQQQTFFKQFAVTVQECGEAGSERDGAQIEPDGSRIPSRSECKEAEEETQKPQP